MQEEFIHKISKGSRFNQIYIPKEATNFEVGDSVKVILLKKKQHLYYSKNLLKLSEFKENLIRQIFSFLGKFKEIKQIFIVGSFLTKKADYKDIDIILVYNKKLKNIKENEEKIYSLLINKFEINFHIIAIPEETFDKLEKICPLTRSMLYCFVSNKEHISLSNTEIDKQHIQFLLMMPEDLLEIKMESRAFYDNLRRILTIEMFLENKNLDPIKIEQEIEKLIGIFLFSQLKNNQPIDNKIIKSLRKIIKTKLKKIKEAIK